MLLSRLELRDHAAPARFAATLVIVIGLTSLTGWALGIHALTSVIPGAVEMKVNTALCVIACGVALLILSDRATMGLDRTGQALGIATALLAAATLSEYLFGWNLGIDELFAKDRGHAYNVFSGRMSPFSTAAFMAIGLSLASLPHGAFRRLTKAGAIFGVAASIFPLLGYLWNAGELVTDTWLPPVALNTAVCFLLLGLGILLSPRRTDVRIADEIAALPAVELRTLTGFALTFSLLLIGGGYTYRTNIQYATSVDWVSHTQEVRAALAGVYGSLAATEIAERDYLLTNDPARLVDYRRLAKDVNDRLANLIQLTSDNPTQQRNASALGTMTSDRLKDIAESLDTYFSSGLVAARAVLARDRDINSTRQVRMQTERMDALEGQFLAERRAAAVKVGHSTLVSLLVTLLVASAVFIYLFGGIHREMRARREAEKALRKSEQYNRSIVDSSPDCLAMLTLDSRLSEMTPQGCRLLDVEDFSTIANTSWLGLWSDADRGAAQAAVAAAGRGEAGRFHGYCPTRNGTPKWWDVIVMPIPGADGRPERLLAVARDISEVHRTETRLTEANRFLDSLIENLPVMVVLKDADTLSFVRHNRAFEKFIGISRERLEGHTARDLFSQEEADFIIAKDREALAAGKLVEIQQSIRTPHMGVRMFHTMKMPIRDEQGKPQYLLAISADITERKRAEQSVHDLNAELAGKAEQLLATNKELESFSYSVSHDLRAPLRAIDGFAMMVEEDYAERLDDEGRRYLSVIRENSKRMGMLIDDLLAFSRLSRLAVVTREVAMNAMVREVIDEVLQPLGEGAPKIHVGPLPPAHADPGLLRQVWTNLISNAVKYSSKAQSPHIEIAGRREGAENQYSVSDNGVGFNMEYIDKLFGVFQRLHRADEFSGTGVGLAIVHRVVTRHGGRVWAEGKVDQGAVFSFALPAGGPDGLA